MRRMKFPFAHPRVRLTLGLLAVAGCNGGSSNGDAAADVVMPPIDALSYDVTPPDGMPQDTNVTDVPPTDGTTGCTLPSTFFPAEPLAFGATDDTPGSVQVSISGEALAELGYDFTATPSASQTVFVDGWEVRFERYLVSVGSVTLNQAGSDPTMQNVVGAVVAQRTGPWIVNVHAHGPLTGAGGAPETSWPLFAWTHPDTGGSFDTTTRYAFTFSTTPASCNAHNVNLVSADMADAQEMASHGWVVLFGGTATYRGDLTAGGATFANYPRTVHFHFGFSDPASYINCHNPQLGDQDTAATRGVQPSATGHVQAQITLHTDHFFWDQSDVEGTPLHFDPIAARVQNFGMGDVTSTTYQVTLSDLMGDNPTALTDRDSHPVTDRSVAALESSMMEASPPPSYRVGSGGSGFIRDLRDFVAYDARSQGHLNSNGLCYVRQDAPITY